MINAHRNLIQCINTGCMKFYDCIVSLPITRKTAKLKYKPMKDCFVPIQRDDEEYDDEIMEPIEIEEEYLDHIRRQLFNNTRSNMAAADMGMQPMRYTITMT